MLKYDLKVFLNNSAVPWIKYNLNLCGIEDVLDDEFIKGLILDAKQKDNILLKRHNDAKHPVHKIELLADLGLTRQLKDIGEIAEDIMGRQSDEGAFLSLQNIPANFGGPGKDNFDWVMCDFPSLLYSLIKFGYKDDARVQKAILFLKSLAQDNGFGCKSSIEKFGGPGKRSDHCPYSNLLCLKVFSLLDEYHNEDFIKTAIDSLLNMWKTKGQRKYRMFGIGTDFKKLKFPNVWFGIVHVLSVLCKYDYAVKTDEFEQMLAIIADKQTPKGGFVPESVFMNFKQCDFGQKKVESDTLTFEIHQIFEAIN